jgi:homocysteine S-methyltransferase
VKTLRDLIRDGAVHLLDGAIGTLLYERGVFVNVCYDELNLTEPGLVEGIHREYVEAGAEIIETNTFGANPVKLSGFGLEEKTEEINRAAAILARRASAGRAKVVGAIGPLGIRIEPWGPTSEAEAEGFFRRQATGLLEGDVDGFLLETFSDLNELKQALKAVRSVSDRPVFAQVTIEEGGNTSYGTDVESVARSLEEWGADVIGVNCSVGPAEILDAVERMARVTEVPLSAQPNAGLPRLVGDRKIYLASPSYMARYARRMVEAGARFVGGCCGTTPEHIREIRDAISETEVSDAPVREAGAAAPRLPAQEVAVGSSPVPLAERSPLGRALAAAEFVASIELLPPQGWDLSGLITDARRARAAGMDVVTLVDAGRGLRRAAVIPAAIVLAGQVDAEIVVHYTCRDRHMLRMISDFLGAAAAGIRNVLVVSGEPAPTGPYPDHTSVFDIDSIGLTNVLHHLNRGVDPGGHAVEPPTRFVVGVALNQGAADLERETSRYRWKVEAGADFAITQPVFDAGALLRFLERAGAPRIPILAGLWPLATLRDAEYLAQEVPGVQVPQEILSRMAGAEARGAEEAVSEGRKILSEVLEAVLPHVQGVHVNGSRGGVELALELAEEARRRAGIAPHGR